MAGLGFASVEGIAGYAGRRLSFKTFGAGDSADAASFPTPRAGAGGAFASGVASPKTVHTFPVSLSTDSGGQTKVDDYKTFKMVATITDPASWIIYKRFA